MTLRRAVGLAFLALGHTLVCAAVVAAPSTEHAPGSQTAALREQASAAFVKNDLAQARSCLTKAIEADKTDWQAYYNLGLVETGAENWDAATKAFQSALSANPDADTADKANRYVELIGKIKERDATPNGKKERRYEEVLLGAEVALASGNLPAAAKLANLAAKLDATHAAPYIMAAKAFVAARDWDGAAAVLKHGQSACASEERSGIAGFATSLPKEKEYVGLLEEAQKSLGSAQYGPAEAALRKAVGLFQNRPDAALLLGVVLARVGRYDEAETVLSPYVKSPDVIVSTSAYRALAEVRVAKEVLNAARNGVADQPAMKRICAAIERNKPRIEKARGGVSRAKGIEAIPIIGGLLNIGGSEGIEARLGGLQSSTKELIRQARELLNGPAAEVVGLSHLQRGEPVEAEIALALALNEQPKNAEFWRRYGQALAYEGRYVDALAAHEMAYSLKPKDAEMVSMMIWDLIWDGKYAQAEERATAARNAGKEMGRNPYLMCGQAEARFKLGKQADGEKLLREAWDWANSAAKYPQYVAETFGCQEGGCAGVERDCYSALMYLGEHHAQTGAYQKALDAYSAASKLSCCEAESFAGAAGTCVKLRDMDGARRYAGEAMDLGMADAPIFETNKQFIAETGSTWRFTTAGPAKGWEKPDFDDSSWQTGTAPFFGGEAVGRTTWSTSEIWLRFVGEVPKEPFIVKLGRRHAGTMEVFVNGKRVLDEKDACDNYSDLLIPLDKLSCFKAGKNVVCVHSIQLLSQKNLGVRMSYSAL